LVGENTIRAEGKRLRIVDKQKLTSNFWMSHTDKRCFIPFAIH
jgi:hypothetical protein